MIECIRQSKTYYSYYFLQLQLWLVTVKEHKVLWMERAWSHYIDFAFEPMFIKLSGLSNNSFWFLKILPSYNILLVSNYEISNKLVLNLSCHAGNSSDIKNSIDKRRDLPQNTRFDNF